MFALGIALSVLVGVSLGFFGGGGSILTVPLLVYVFGLAPKEAIASSLIIVGIASLSGAVQHWRAGNVRPKAALVFGATGMVGAYLGGRAGAFLEGGLLLLLFAAMMLPPKKRGAKKVWWVGPGLFSMMIPGKESHLKKALPTAMISLDWKTSDS